MVQLAGLRLELVPAWMGRLSFQPPKRSIVVRVHRQLSLAGLRLRLMPSVGGASVSVAAGRGRGKVDQLIQLAGLRLRSGSGCGWDRLSFQPLKLSVVVRVFRQSVAS